VSAGSFHLNSVAAAGASAGFSSGAKAYTTKKINKTIPAMPQPKISSIQKMSPSVNRLLRLT
jgi:hypothetical protein